MSRLDLPESTLRVLAEKYPPLDYNEERILAKAMREGTDEERTDARERLILHNAKAALQTVRSFSIRDNELLRDVEAAAMMGLIKSVDSFDPSWSTRISTYSKYRIKLEAWNVLVEYNTSQSINRYVYKQVAMYIKKHPDYNDEQLLDYISNQFNVNEFIAGRVLSISRAGVRNFSEVISDDEQNESMEVSDMGTSVFAGCTVDNPEVKITIERLANRVEAYSKENLRPKQQRVIELIVLPFLRERREVSIGEAAAMIGCNYQAVDQLFKYMRSKMVCSDEGLLVNRVIDAVLKTIKGKA